MQPPQAEVELSFEKRILAADVLPLMAQTDWANSRKLSDVEQALSATAILLGAWKGRRLVGFARAITDGRYRALIDDVIVDESMRGQGLGGRMMTLLAQRLSGVEEVFLRCDAHHVSFYQRLGYRQTAVCLDLVKTQ